MDRLKEVLRKSECDAIIIQSELSSHYFSGFYADFSYILASGESINYYTDLRYYDEAVDKLKGFNVKLITAANALEVIKNDISSFRKIGVDESNVYYSDFIRLKAILPQDIELIGKFVLQRRAVKNADEILLTETAVDITDSAFGEVLEIISEGMTEKELVYNLDSRMIKMGADGPAFDTIVAFSENAAFPHWVKSDRKLKHGDTILMDFGAKYRGYCADMTRVVSFGKANEEFKTVYNIVKEANERAIDRITPGMTAHQGDAIARDYIKAKGYGENFTHSLGHGIGMEVHESLRVAPNSETTLKKGMLFTIEPGIYLKGKFGVRIEDLVCLTDKVNRLTGTDKELIEL